jgi:hypothetical protein
MSVEIDILPIADDNTETARLADLIEGVAGEFSPFEELHGFSIDGVDLRTSALPTGWRSRLVKVQPAPRRRSPRETLTWQPCQPGRGFAGGVHSAIGIGLRQGRTRRGAFVPTPFLNSGSR